MREIRSVCSGSGTFNLRPSTVSAGRGRGPVGLALAVALSAVPAHASAQAESTSAPPPGHCAYIQPQVKQCSVSTEKGVGTFDVTVSPPAGLVITFEEAVVGMQPPPSSSYKAIFSEQTATVVPVRKD